MGFFGWLKPKPNLRDWVVRFRLVDKKLQRQRQKLVRDEKKARKEIERAMKNGDRDTAKLFATDLVRSRRMALGCQKLSGQVKGIMFKLEHADAMQTVAKDMAGLVMAMRGINQTLSLPELDQVMMAMEGEMEKFGIAMEGLDEGFDMIQTEVGDDEEVNAILDEVATGIVEGPAGIGALPAPAIGNPELQKELEKLKKGEKG